MDKILLFKDNKDCCACGACVNKCPKQAITMQEDEYGFMYPVIDVDRCFKCGLCVKTCAYQNSVLEQEPQTTFIAQTKNTDIKKSASGGVFASISRQFIEAGGVIFGTALDYEDNILEPRYIMADNLKDLEKLLGSKYVQSSTGNIFTLVKEQLLKNIMILFCGTPCQVDGLKTYLGGRHYENLYCVDIICHGVPSKKMFQDYIRFMEQKYNDKILDFKFRDKTNGWGLTANVYTANASNKLIPCYMSSYYDMFLKSYTYRINCYSCKYANKHRVGDVTIGDFWGVEIEHPEVLCANGGDIDEKQGVSCIIVNNTQGKKLLSNYGNGLMLVKSQYDKVAKHNGQLNKPCILNEKKRNGVLEAYYKNGYTGVEKWYKKDLGVKGLVKNKIKSILPTFIKQGIKMILNFK